MAHDRDADEHVRDVVVVGGGIAGLAATWALRDHDVLLLEADPAHTSVNDALRGALAERFGGRLRREVVPEATHVIFRTALDETAAAVRSFLG